MNLLLSILEEHSKQQTVKIINYIGNDKKLYKELLDLFFKSDYRVTQRASWPLSEIAILHPDLVKPHLDKLVHKLKDEDTHPAIPRNILRMFQEIEIPEKHHGTLIDLCFAFITDLKHPVAVRAFAITVASRICALYPELKNELVLILEDLKKYPQQPAITARIKSAFKKLNLNN